MRKLGAALVFESMTYKTNVKLLMNERGINNSAMGRALKISSQAVSQWFSPEGEPPKDRVEQIAEVLGVDPGDLLSNDLDKLLKSRPAPKASVESYVPIKRPVIRPGAGGPGAFDEEMQEPILMPVSLIRDALKGRPDDFVYLEVEGQSMQPVLESGDHILVDRRKTDPSNPGLFVVWDGTGLVTKWVEFAREYDPPRLRLMSENKRFTTYEPLLEESQIVGRIVWYARKL